MASTAVLFKELVGDTCRCGRPKRTRETFCSRCYWRLPKHMRSALYRLMGDGYEEAYAAATAYLDDPRGVDPYGT